MGICDKIIWREQADSIRDWDTATICFVHLMAIANDAVGTQAKHRLLFQMPVV